MTAEVCFDQELWAVLVEREGADGLTLEIYPRADRQPWSLPFALAIEALTVAKQRLTPA